MTVSESSTPGLSRRPRTASCRYVAGLASPYGPLGHPQPLPRWHPLGSPLDGTRSETARRFFLQRIGRCGMGPKPNRPRCFFLSARGGYRGDPFTNLSLQRDGGVSRVNLLFRRGEGDATSQSATMEFAVPHRVAATATQRARDRVARLPANPMKTGAKRHCSSPRYHPFPW